jgi:hypothetical protein
VLSNAAESLSIVTQNHPFLNQAQYDNKQTVREKCLEEQLTQIIAPAARSRGYFKKDELLVLCDWKTNGRACKRCNDNSEEFVEDVTRLVFTASNEQLRIEGPTLLKGVKFPTASTVLHFAFESIYPIMDRRALSSVCNRIINDVAKWYTFERWISYAKYCQKIVKDCGVSMRHLDKALWAYDKYKH